MNKKQIIEKLNQVDKNLETEIKKLEDIVKSIDDNSENFQIKAKINCQISSMKLSLLLSSFSIAECKKELTVEEFYENNNELINHVS